MFIPFAMVISNSSLVLLWGFFATNLLSFVFLFFLPLFTLSLSLTLVMRPLDLSCQKSDYLVIYFIFIFVMYRIHIFWRRRLLILCTRVRIPIYMILLTINSTIYTTLVCLLVFYWPYFILFFPFLHCSRCSNTPAVLRGALFIFFIFSPMI